MAARRAAAGTGIGPIQLARSSPQRLCPICRHESDRYSPSAAACVATDDAALVDALHELGEARSLAAVRGFSSNGARKASRLRLPATAGSSSIEQRP